MDLISGFLSVVVPFLIVLTVLVFVHELGHFLVARYFGVRVEVFSVGFGREIFGWTDRTGTRWKFSLIPLGGYVKMFGDANAASQPGSDVDALPPEDRAYAFQTKPLHARTAIVAAGPLANFLFALVVLTGLFMVVGQRFTPPVAGEIVADSAAAAAGIQPGDRFVELNGKTIERFEDIQRIVRPSAGRSLDAVVLRDGEPVTLTLVPRPSEVTDPFGNTEQIGLVGITRSSIDYMRHGPVEAVWRSAGEIWEISVGTLQAVGQIIVGSRSAEQLGGPLRIAQMSGTVAESGVVPVLWFMTVLSINLGLINLFPVPMLDGGHLLFYGIEAVRGRPLGERAQEYGFRIGLAVVFSLMLFVTLNDLIQLEVFDFLRRLVT